MNRDKKILYTISALTFAALLSLLFINVPNSKIVTACLLIPLTAVTILTVKKRGSLSINKKEVLLLSFILGAIYVVLIHMSGIFFGFYQNPYKVSTEGFFTTVLPIAVIIVCCELIRYVLLAQKNRFVSFLAYLSCVIAEALSYSTLVGIENFNQFMNFFGMTLFPAICANIYYHYASKRYGAIPNIAFRFITTLYIYFVPTMTAMSDAMLAMTKLILPIAMLAFITAMFEKKQKTANQKGNKLSLAGVILASAAVVLIAMLISCQFRFGALVIATESMTGEINKGDMIIYEEYKKQKIEEGQVIVFLQNESRVIHRVVGIEQIGGETRYYTKGDANPTNDSGYRTEADIVGLTDLKLAYAGYPTLWLRELLSSN